LESKRNAFQAKKIVSVPNINPINPYNPFNLVQKIFIGEGMNLTKEI
jgi:hypothetical protein